MKKILTKIKETKNKLVFKACCGLAIVTDALALTPATAYAANNGITGYSNGSNSNDMKNMTNGLIDQIAALMTYVGAVVLAVGIIQVIMAFKNEDADGKTRGMLVAVTGIALIAIRSILSAVVPGFK